MIDFDTFLKYKIKYEKERHQGNPYWKTDEQVIENLGSKEQIEGLYNLWYCVSPETQKRCCGFSENEITN